MTNISFPLAVSSKLGSRLRPIIERVIRRDRRICQMCGADETDICPFDHCAVTLFVTTHVAVEKGGRLEDDNLKTVCSTCADRLMTLHAHSKSDIPPKPKRVKLLSQTRRATIEDQKHLLEWLLTKFKLKAVAAE